MNDPIPAETPCICSMSSFAANQWHHFPECPRSGDPIPAETLTEERP
jgi:hypothetical protein